jgi:ankyrin repeat protein
MVFLKGSEKQDIFQVVNKGDLESLKSMTQENPCLVHKVDQRGCTPLFHAIIRKNQEMVKLLIKNGALVRVGDNNLRAPIHYAGFMNDIPMIQLLLDQGAVVDTRAIGAATPLIHSSLSNRLELSQFLIQKGADINIQCNSLTTPLYFAVLNNNMDLLTFLLDKGADIDTPDFLYRTPFYIAVRDGYKEMVETLITHGANYEFRDKILNRSMLHLAAIQGHTLIAQILIKAGLEKNIKDKRGFTPMDYALKYGHTNLAKMLKGKGGKAYKIKKNPSSTKVLKEDIDLGQARIFKLQNGSWGIMTKSKFLILAYSQIGSPPSERSILNGYITTDELKTKELVYIDLSYHPAKARYALQGENPTYAMQDQMENLAFILNPNFKRAYQNLKLKNVHYPKAKEIQEINGLKVTAVPSYLRDMGYFIQCDGLDIFWLSGISDSYICTKWDARAIEYVAKHFPKVDLLVLGTPNGIGPEKGNSIKVAYLETIKLNPKFVIFMGKSPLERRIFNQIKRIIQEPNNIYIAENPGDNFLYFKTKIW